MLKQSSDFDGRESFSLNRLSVILIPLLAVTVATVSGFEVPDLYSLIFLISC